jgi:hypothetical protein
MNTTRRIHGFIITMVMCVAAGVSGCSNTGYGCGPLCALGEGGGGGGGGNPPTPVFSTTTIAANDTEPVNAGGTQWDITQVVTNRTGSSGGHYDEIAVSVTFSQSTAFGELPAPGSTPTGSAALGLLIYFDTDSNPATGITPTLCGNAYTGMDYAVTDGSISGRLSNGNYDIIKLSTLTKSGEATVYGSGNTISYLIPLSAIGGVTSGLMGVAASNFMGGDNTVDCAPDGATVST